MTAKTTFDAGRRRGSRAKRLLAVAAALVASLALAASAGASTPRNFYGIVNSTALTNGDLNRMGKAHVGSLRVILWWPSIQPKHHGPMDWSAVDQAVAGAASEHISLLATLTATPRYEAHGCASHHCAVHIEFNSRGRRRDWNDFVKAAVQRYGRNGDFWTANPYVPYDPILRWQVWNEENNPAQKNSSRVYAHLLAASSKKIHATDPRAKVIVGGMFGTPRGGKHSTAWAYLSSLYKHGAGKHFDAVALHPYSPTISGIRTQIERVRKVLKRHHDSRRQTFITEIGWGSSKKRHGGTGSRGAAFNVGPKEQKRKLAQSFGLLTRHRRGWRLGGVYWYQWKDPKHAPPGLCAFCYSSGLYKANGRTAKPALSAFRHYTRKAHG